MASLLVFEDFEDAIWDVHEAIADTPHFVAGEAASLNYAQVLIRKILSKEIVADVLLLDGNLDGSNQPHEFRHAFPLDGSEPVKKSLFGKTKPPLPHEIIVPNTERGFGADARMIKRILQVCEIDIPIIGISADPMLVSGVEVDFDLGKSEIRSGLIPALQNLVQ